MNPPEDRLWRCSRCGMTFEIAPPGPSAETARCPECRAAFYSSMQRGGVVAVGMRERPSLRRSSAVI